MRSFADLDQHVWRQRSRLFKAFHDDSAKRAAMARKRIEEFLSDGDATVSVSWGKDSVTTAHLAASIDPKIAIRWTRVSGLEMPGTLAVRDAFLEMHPHVAYQEIAVDLPIMRGEPGFPGVSVDYLADSNTGRTITGIRAAESRQRAMSARVHGVMTAKTCRPIIDWPDMTVFAYLDSEGLPIHVAYRQSLGGRLSLSDIRVHALGTATLHGSSFWPRIVEWEDHYYGDTLGEELARRARR